MPRKRSEPKAMKLAGKPVSPDTGAPPVIRNTTPRTSTMVPSVVMNGLTSRNAMTRPLASPTAAPAAIPASTPAAMPACSITIAATQPASAAVEPTERSKPPPMITKVMPRAITAMIEDCTRMLVRLSGERNRSVSSAVTAHNTISEISGMWPAIFKRRMSPADRRLQLRLVEPLRAIERGGDAALPHRQHAVAEAGELAEIAGIEQRGAAAGDEIANELVDLHLGGDVDPLRRLVEQQHGDAPRQPFRQDHLLLIAAGERAGRQLRPARTDVEERHQLGDDAIAGSAVDDAIARERVEVGKQNIVAHRQAHDQAKRALRRHHADAGGDGVGRMSEPARLAADLDRRRLAGGAEQAT